MRALVTGSTGFIGRRLCAIFRGRGDTVVVALRGDDIHAIMRDAKPDVVFHLAGAYVRDHTPCDVANLVQSNVEYGAHVLEAMRVCGVRRIVTAGSVWTVPSPVNLYAATKRAFEKILTYYCVSGSIFATTLLLGDTYGPEDRRDKIVSRMVRAIINDEELPMTKGNQIIDLIHVDDVCAAFIHAAALANQEPPPYRWALQGERLKLRHLARCIEHVMGKPLRAQWGAIPYPANQIMNPEIHYTLPDWTPSIQLLEGLAQLVAYNA